MRHDTGAHRACAEYGNLVDMLHECEPQRLKPRPSKPNQNATFAARDELPRKFIHHPVLTLELILVFDRDDVTPYSTGKKAEWQTGLIRKRTERRSRKTTL